MSPTSIHIEITQESHTPVRRHVNIPAGDQLTQDWFDAQTNQSASVRLLIRDEIRRHGMVDRVTRERFGSAARPAAAAAPAGSAFTAPTTPPSPSAAAAAVPTPWAVPGVTPASADPKDVEIQRLTDLVRARDHELGRLRDALGPFGAFIGEVAREDGFADLVSPHA